jgi:hypothetical protein
MMTRICWMAALIIPAALGYAQQSTGQQPAPNKSSTQKAAKKRSTSARRGADEFGKIRIAHDDTGYIESAFIQSQLRFRFDSAFGDRNIDLAGFFYKGGGLKNGLKNTVSKLNFREYHLFGEYAFAGRLSAFADVPIRSISPTVSYECRQVCAPAGNQGFSGLSDVRAGFKLGLISRPGQQLTFQLSTSFPTGNTAHGLGTDHNTIEPFVLYAQTLSPSLNIFGEIGDTHPIGGVQSSVTNAPSSGKQNFAGDVVNYGVGASYGVSQQSRVRFAPVLELVGWKVTGGLVTIVAPCLTGQSVECVVSPNSPPAYGSNIVNLKWGLRTSWGDHNSIYAGGGTQLSHAGWYREVFRIEYRYIFKRPL